MKNLIYLLLASHLGFSQLNLSIPEAPNKIEFADVIIELNADAKKSVNDEINKLLTPQNSFLEAKLERMQWYFPIIEPILASENVPEDMKYLAVLESSLIPESVSTSNAVGFWQFKKETAEEMGLLVSNAIDERKYIHASTRAAAMYLKRNNLIFKNWISSIYSYNQGAGGAADALPTNWSYASEIKFDKETPYYLIKALAHRIAFEHRLNRMKFSDKEFVEYPVSGRSLSEIAVELTVDLSELRKYNSWLNAAKIPENKEYNVLIPVLSSKADEIRKKLNSKTGMVVAATSEYPKLKRTSAMNTAEGVPVLYEINGKKGILAEPGDEVAQLAKKGGISIINFLKYNDLSDRDMVQTGMVYYLQKKGKKGPLPLHTAGVNQSLWDVAHMYGVTLKSLLKYNRMQDMERLQAGRVVFMQKKRPKRQAIQIQQIEEKPVEEKPLPVEERYASKTEPKPEPKPEPKEDIPVPAPENTRPADPIPVKKESTKSVLAPVISDSKAVSTSKPAANKPSGSSNSTHRVQKGETLYSISRKYGVTVADLRSWNNISSTDVLQYDQILNIGSSTKNSSTKTTPNDSDFGEPGEVENATKISEETHVVKAGETLFSISKKYGTTVASLQGLNSLLSTDISVGQRLRVRAAANYSSPTSHTVTKGETLYSISKKYGITVANLKSWNNLSTNAIFVGQKLRVK